MFDSTVHSLTSDLIFLALASPTLDDSLRHHDTAFRLFSNNFARCKTVIVPSHDGRRRKRDSSPRSRSQGAFKNTSYIREGLHECEYAAASRIEIYCFIGNHLNAGGLFYEVTTKERLLGKWLL